MDGCRPGRDGQLLEHRALSLIAAAVLPIACTSVTIVDGSPSRHPTRDSAGDPVENIPGDSAGDSADTAPNPDGPPFDHLPVLIIDTHGGIVDGVKHNADLEIITLHDGTLADLDSAPRAYAGPIGIEIHGSSSTGYPKLGYRFECRDDAGADINCGLVGLPDASDWVLRAPYADKTYMRDALAYAFARDVAADGGRWEPHTQFVELFLDEDYVGVYVLVERVSREQRRLNLPRTTNIETGKVDGGFIVKVDQHRSAGFDTARGSPLDWVEPGTTQVTPAEAAYLLDWFDQFESMLSGSDFADSAAGYSAWIDQDAWVDHWLVNELAHNIDAYRLSAYLYVDGPPGAALLRAGPAWDFDRAWGNCNYCDSWTTADWIYDSLDRCGYAYEYTFWWQRLREDPSWNSRIESRWQALRAGVLSDDAIVARIEAMQAETAEAEVRDHERWPVIGTWVDPNVYVGGTWDEEVTWLRDWALERAAWMDAHAGEG